MSGLSYSTIVLAFEVFTRVVRPVEDLLQSLRWNSSIVKQVTTYRFIQFICSYSLFVIALKAKEDSINLREFYISISVVYLV